MVEKTTSTEISKYSAIFKAEDHQRHDEVETLGLGAPQAQLELVPTPCRSRS